MRLAAALIAVALSACRTPAIVSEPKPRKPPQPIAAVVPWVPGLDAAPDEAALLAQAGFPGGAVGWLAVDAATGDVLAGLEASRGFPPGSVAKVATASAALDVLTERHAFRTDVLHTGTIRAGVLDGDLVLVGGGDPALSLTHLAALAHEVRLAGVRRVAGRLLYDETLFAPPSRIAGDQDDDSTFDPGVGALGIDQNLTTVRWKAVAGGAVAAWAVPAGAATFALAPPDAATRFTRGPSPVGEPWALSADAPPQGEQRLPVWRPGEHAALVFARLLATAGVEVPLPAAGTAAPGAKPLARHAAPPLRDLLQQSLVTSSNPVTEMISLAIARQRTGRPATVAEAGAALTAFFREHGIELSLENGSGLSPRSRLSPRAAVAILRRAARHPGPPFYTLLPVSGWSGTLARRLGTPDVALRVWAKTGTISYGIGLAGHLFARSGREVVFALFVAEPALRAAARAEPVRTRDDATRRDAAEEAWFARARALQDALVTRWIERY